MLFDALLFTITFLFSYYLYLYVTNRRKLPPGPFFFLPILGHLPFLGENPATKLLQWSKIYGPILYVRLGSHGAIVINDAQLLRKAFSLNSFSGRPHSKLFDTVSGNRKGFVLADGPKAVEQRKFIQRLLKSFGFGTTSMESRILDQTTSLLDVFEDHLAKPLTVNHAFNHSMVNTLWSIVTGKCFDKNDKALKKLAKTVTTSMSEMPTVIEKLCHFLDFIPEWFPELSGFNKKVRGMLEVREFLHPIIEEHRGSKVLDQPRDIIDAFLDEVEKTSDPQSAFFTAHDSIKFVMQELFVVGVETTSTALEWIIFYLAKYRDVQEKLQQEIDTVLETKSLPSYEDRHKLPYVEAVIQEISRIASIGPLALLHRALEDTIFNGYNIPKGTTVVGNLYAVQHDKDLWGDPETFRPERFIDKGGNFIENSDILAFSCGKRSCIGEQLARQQMFLYTVSIFKHFNVKPVGELPSEKGVFGFTLSALPFQIHVSKRK